MGAWSTEAFGNDTACDWACELEKCNDLSRLEAAVSAVLDCNTDYLDADVAQTAVAAIEVMARLRGHAASKSAATKTADEWVARVRIAPSNDLIKRALGVLDLVAGSRSELRDLWMEGDESGSWLAAIADLRQRLQAEPRPLALADADPGDAVSRLVRRLQGLTFEHLEIGANPAPLALFNATVISGALDDAGRTRELTSRAWRTFDQLDQPKVLWDLAVRDAKTWAAQGHLDEALSQLESWKRAPGALTAGTFEMWASGVCMAGRNLDLAREYFARAEAIAPDNHLRRLDEALMEARLGSLERARSLVRTAEPNLGAAAGRALSLTKGIIACRSREPDALPLLTAAASDFVDAAEKGPGAWPILSYLCGWWALALDREGRGQQAREIIRSVQPILMCLHNRELIVELRALGLLAADADIPEFPAAAPANDPSISASAALTDHGGFKTLRMRGVNALKKVESLRFEFENGSRLYPFLVGDERDLSGLLNSLEPPQDGGVAHLAAAKRFDVAGWLRGHMRKPPKGWPKQPAAPLKSPLIQYDGIRQQLKPELVIGLMELDHPSELFARLGFGGWNDCPAPPMHTALHAYWQQLYGAQPIAVSGDTVECVVASALQEQAAALHLACEHQAYCDDIVEQGFGTTAKLGSSLLGAKYWYFWWD